MNNELTIEEQQERLILAFDCGQMDHLKENPPKKRKKKSRKEKIAEQKRIHKRELHRVSRTLEDTTPIIKL